MMTAVYYISNFLTVILHYCSHFYTVRVMATKKVRWYQISLVTRRLATDIMRSWIYTLAWAVVVRLISQVCTAQDELQSF